jgi:N-hydroxyarylamine O-acetyltransferase
MSNEFRLDRYLERIKVTGTLAADLATLKILHAAHAEIIPFDGLDPLLGRPVKLDLASLQNKLVDSRRGGYCHEQNALFRAALDAIGFRVTGLSGRARWIYPPDSPLGPRTHMLLKVDLPEGPFIADVGFGVCVIDAPLEFKTGVEQRTAMGTYRLSEADGLFWLSAKQPESWRMMYAFNLEPQLPADYELANYYTSTSPQALFTSNLIMERVGRDERHKLVNRRFRVEARDGELVLERIVESADELWTVLDETFGVTPPAPADQLLSRIRA